jgi:hypothetical protein
MMDDHFSKMLAPTAQGNAPAFLPAESFEGSRPGYVFQMNSQGLGYYLDPACSSPSSAESSMVSAGAEKTCERGRE